jgi:hypothetical protein
MEEQKYLITFEDISVAEANRYASELRNALLDATTDIEVYQTRSDDRTQDFGATLVLILGTPAVLAVAKALGDWLKLRNSAKITIDKDGQVIAENLTSKDALKLAELLRQQK